MRLVPNWKKVLRYAWSVKLLIAAGLLSGVEVALPLLGDVLPFSMPVRAGLLFCVVASAFVARLIAQQSVSGDGA